MVRLDGLCVQYGGQVALQAVSGHFAAGSLTAVVGPNGAGKSTLLKSIAGLLPSAPGMVTLDLPRQRMAYLPQRAEMDRSFPMDVRDCVLLGCWGSTGAWGRVTPALLARVDAALDAVGLRGWQRHRIGSLSSGQLQRVLFARLIVQDAQLLLLDEPFSAMDAATTADLLALVQQWHRAQRTVVAVLHDDAMVHQHFPDTLRLARSVVGWGPTAQVLAEVRA